MNRSSLTREDKFRLIAACALALVILVAWEYFYEIPRQDRLTEQQLTQTLEQPAITPKLTEGPGQQTPQRSVDRQTNTGSSVDAPRIPIESDTVQGSLSLRGATIDRLDLLDFRTRLDPQSPPVQLLSSTSDQNRLYTVSFGWVGRDLDIPTSQTLWALSPQSAQRLTPESPVTLQWTNEAGRLFEITLELDDDFLFTATLETTTPNRETSQGALSAYGLIRRGQRPPTNNLFISHEGMSSWANDQLNEIDYDDVTASEPITYTTVGAGGWVGFADKYWLTALSAGTKAASGRFIAIPHADGSVGYQSDLTLNEASGASTTSHTLRLFAGAKRYTLLRQYQNEQGFTGFIRAIDFGWLYFITRPIFELLRLIHSVVGNFGIAILLLTVLVKLAFFPLASKSYRSMSKMRLLQPKINALRERYGKERSREMSAELMKLYRSEGVNPVSGCLPMLLQIPVFFALYKVLFVTIEMRHAPFFGWIQDLSAPDPIGILTAFGLISWEIPGLLSFLNIGPWPLLMGLTMWLQQKLNPPPPDPTQARIFALMPLFFMFLLGSFPAGLVIYWAWNNTLSILQQAVIMRSAGVDLPRLFFSKPSKTETKP